MEHLIDSTPNTYKNMEQTESESKPPGGSAQMEIFIPNLPNEQIVFYFCMMTKVIIFDHRLSSASV